jgi:hypothetical protein
MASRVTPGHGTGDAVTYHHPGRGDSWTLYPDAAGDVTMDARVVGLMLAAAGYERITVDAEAS